MKFILHCGIDENNIENTLGKPEYSYFFVMEGYRKALERLGEVVLVQDPSTEVDAIHEMEPDSLFLSFAPPNHAPVDLACPTSSVFAWEFSNIPYETWDDDPRNDWRYVLERHGQTIALSEYSVQAVKDAMGADFPAAAVPVPVWDAMAGVRSRLSQPNPEKAVSLDLDVDVLDSRHYDFNPVRSHAEAEQATLWEGDDYTLEFSFNSRAIHRLQGFYAPEEWGAWSRANKPVIDLPEPMLGKVYVTLKAHAFRSSADREITMSLGSSKANLVLTEAQEVHHLEFNLLEPAVQVAFSGLITIPPLNSEDKRTLGIGLASLSFSRNPPEEDHTAPAADEAEQAPVDAPAAVEENPHQEQDGAGVDPLELDGIVYTSVFNPGDGRKNWKDLVTAFCIANRDHADATLVLKMVTNDPDSYMQTLPLLLSQLAPFKCRVVAIRGYLPQQQFEQLIASSTYYVNCSHCEGLCLPLMEFLAGGVPAIAPDHTAMADYIDDEVAFIVKSSVEQNVWPGDKRDLFRTLRYRINWESLHDAFEQSYEQATSDADAYRSMSTRARERLQAVASVDAVTAKLKDFLDR